MPAVLEPGGVYLTPRDAWALLRLTTPALRELRRTDGRIPADSQDVLAALGAAASRHQAQLELLRGELVSSLGRPSEDTPADSGARKRLLGTAEAADQLGCHARTVRRMVADGRLRASRLGRDLLIDADSLHEERTTA